MEERFGCEKCWPESAEDAYSSTMDFDFEASLIHESHFWVHIGRCCECNQRFVRVFTELIDWEGGDDSMRDVLMPITEEEAGALLAHGGNLDESVLNGLGSGRRSLVWDKPKGREPAVRWSSGVFVLPHD